MDNQIRKTDPAYRKKTFIIMLIAVLTGLVLLGIFYAYLGEIRSTAQIRPDEAFTKIMLMLRTVLSLMAFSLLILSAIIAHISFRTVRTSVFPPPDMKVIRDTRIIRGREAKHRGVIGIIIALIIFATALLFPWLFYMNMEKAFL